MGAWLTMWTRKAAFTLVAGLSLILIGMMISNFQMMILGFTFIAFITVNSWMSGHGDIEVQRTLSADNLYRAMTSTWNCSSSTSAARRPSRSSTTAARETAKRPEPNAP